MSESLALSPIGSLSQRRGPLKFEHVLPAPRGCGAGCMIDPFGLRNEQRARTIAGIVTRSTRRAVIPCVCVGPLILLRHDRPRYPDARVDVGCCITRNHAPGPGPDHKEKRSHELPAGPRVDSIFISHLGPPPSHHLWVPAAENCARASCWSNKVRGPCAHSLLVLLFRNMGSGF